MTGKDLRNNIKDVAKTCAQCGTEKPAAEFYKRSGTGALMSYCKACVKANAVKWKAENPEKSSAFISKWRAENQDKVKATCAAWYESNTDKAKEKSAKWYAANKSKVNARALRWAAANRDKANSASAKWRSSNPEACRIHIQNRRSRQRETGGALSTGIAAKLFVLQQGKCACGCNQPLGDDYHLDHRMPLALGGTNSDENIQLLRAKCNLQKGAKHPVDFMQSRGFLL